MTFEKIDSRLYAATFNAKIGSRTYRVDLRIDGREGDYRLDRLGTLGFIWEAIDGGRGFSSVAKATAHARKWRDAAVAERDLCPRVER